jgi:hypothetical protein
VGRSRPWGARVFGPGSTSWGPTAGVVGGDAVAGDHDHADAGWP